MKTNPSNRQYDLDWLRVLATGAVFLFHNARAFNQEDWHIKNGDLSFGASIFVSALAQWIMPLMFLVSAYAIVHSLIRRANGQIISERFNRLMIPLLVGAFTHIALQVYIERVSHGQFSGSFFEFIPRYFEGWYGFGGNFAWMGLHLWYLLMLFLFTLITLPLFRRLLDNNVRLPAFLEKPGVLLLLALPIVLMEMLVNLQPDLLGRRDFGGWSPLTYLVYYVMGYLLALDDRAGNILQRNRRLALGLGLAATIVGYFWLTGGYSSRDPIYALIRGVNSWAWLVTILGYASCYLNFDHPRLKGLNELILPFYILHQTVIVTVAFYVTRWEAGILTKYIVIASTSFIVILAFLAVIQRVNILRYLFGMKGVSKA